MTQKAFPRIYKDNTKYAEDKLFYIDALAITVQKHLYRKRNAVYYIGDTIQLWDFMTITRYFIAASTSEFGQSDIETYISAIDDYSAQIYGGDAVVYTKEQNHIIVNGTPAMIMSLLWAAWIYARVRSDVASNNKKQLWQRAVEQLYTSMEDYYDDPDHKCFGESNRLLSMTDDAMNTMGTYMAEQIQKGKYAHQQKIMPAKESSLSAGEDVVQLQARINELQQENESLNKQLEEYRNQQKANETQEVKNDEWTVELFTPLCYKDEQVARDILDDIRGKEDAAIADIIIERKKKNQISPKTQNRELWKILHAAKLYRGTEGNFNTALRRRQQR